MNRWPIQTLCVGALVLAACTPVIERAEVEPPPPTTATPTPTPPPTPHPALAARERAVQMYPDLGIKDSLFHRTFMELFEDAKVNRPQILTAVDWPIMLAHRSGNMLGVSVAQPPPPTPPPAPMPPPPAVIYVTPKPENRLDRGAYDHRRVVSGTPRLY